ncbi:Bromodomain-containing protein [Quillaja saponaria]|uniref:Bromodomain-containing protein n=1 Tax=Quillaja saponaria TaxID=32244 RepID=A0AAD7LZC3_QUISA|nr:Bromodomain-containing protein [Quillaja saponaria]
MGKVVERKKKKGRPSLLDLQKRTLKEQQLQQLNRISSSTNSKPNYRTALTPIRRSTRRNTNPDGVSTENINDDEEDDEGNELLTRKRREKKLKLVLKLPSQRSSLNSASPNSCGSDSNGEADNATSNKKKRKINPNGDGSEHSDSDKGESISGTNPTKPLQGTLLDSGPSTPLPDKNLLLFILDRLQKKDTYGVFSEPVDPKELPDYHEVIEHPMDFGTVRKKLGTGAYASLEQFEKDVFLICSNAMQYNSPDTIYFRQARSIQELAQKNFENLRQDSDDNELEPKIVRRGRPPTKFLKKPLVRPSVEHAASEFSSDATLVTGVENNTRSKYDLRKGLHAFERSVFSNWLADNRVERNDENTGSMLKGNLKNGKKQFVLDESRRNTYQQFQLSAGGQEPSVLTTFDRDKKQLLPVGLHAEYGYARSLAQFAAHLGPVAWKIASKKIEKCLPAGTMFGPGWVAENDIIQHRPLPQPSHASALLSPLQQFPVQSSSSRAAPYAVDSRAHKSSEKPEGYVLSEKRAPSDHFPLDGYRTKSVAPCFNPSSSSAVVNVSSEPLTGKVEASQGSNSHIGSNVLNSSAPAMRSRTPFPIPPSSGVQPGTNGFNGVYGINLAAHVGKPVGVSQLAGLNSDSSPTVDTLSRTNTNLSHLATSNILNSVDPKHSENLRRKNSGSTLSNLGNESVGVHKGGLDPRMSRQPHQKPESVPPDLNVRFQAPASPSCSRVDSTPDLALQL